MTDIKDDEKRSQKKRLHTEIDGLYRLYEVRRDSEADRGVAGLNNVGAAVL